MGKTSVIPAERLPSARGLVQREMDRLCIELSQWLSRRRIAMTVSSDVETMYDFTKYAANEDCGETPKHFDDLIACLARQIEAASKTGRW